jgi:O-acetyl-ADP-ribose deacetylase (regulator of RNase III)
MLAVIRKGKRYRSRRPLKVIAMTSWAAPCTGGDDAILPADEEFIVSHDPAEGATAVYCDPVRYEELHAHFVGAEDRKNKRYCGYYLCVPLAAIRRSCELVPEKVPGDPTKWRRGESPMSGITYVKGDATCPQAKGRKLICHICNDLGGWGKGFVLALSRRWAEPERKYRAWYADRRRNGFGLGSVQFVQVEPYIWIANMVAQRGMKRGSSGPPIRYDAVAECLQQVAAKARELGASVHMPRIGCGLAGGDWSVIESLIEQHLVEVGVPVTVYDFE